MLIELHAHTHKWSSCSVMNPVDFIKTAIARHLQGVLITEHHRVWSEEEIRELRRNSGAPGSFVIMAAQEVSTDFGHVLVIGPDQSIADKTRVSELRRAFPKAALIWAHAWRSGSVPKEEKLISPLLDAIEIFSGNHRIMENYKGLQAWHKYRFTAVSGSDSHSLDKVGAFPTLLDHRVTSAWELAQEIRQGHCRPFYKEIPKSGGNSQVLEVTFGAKGENEKRQRLIVRSFQDEEKWDRAIRTAGLTGDLHQRPVFSGMGEFRVPDILHTDPEARVIIEEGQRGRRLAELLPGVGPGSAAMYLQLTARWLARFHHETHIRDNQGASASQGYNLDREMEKLERYSRRFQETISREWPLALKVLEILQRDLETWPSSGRASGLVHGDFHPGNIIIGQDIGQDIETLFISVIDFENSFRGEPAFDLGYFKAQLESQFRKRPDILAALPWTRFMDSYLKECAEMGMTIDSQELEERIAIYEARGLMSIGAFFIKLGMGQSDELRDTVLRAGEVLKIS